MSFSITLVSSPVLGEFRSLTHLDRSARRVLARPPLGVLAVAAVLRRQGVDQAIFDTDRFWLQQGLEQPDSTLDLAARAIAALGHQWVGFSTICSSYHMSLRLAAKVKALSPETRILLGGPQASATAKRTMEVCPQVDAVLCGEVEESLPVFVKCGHKAPSLVPGLVWRHDGLIHQNPWPSPPPASAFLTPAYDLWAQESVPFLPVEAGRGCPYGCRFCSTSPFFGRRFRTRPASVVVAECETLVTAHKSREVTLINDHIAVEMEFVRQLARLWKASPVLRDVPFSCSLRPDSASAEVVSLLAEGGATKVFLGIETGSQRMQKVVGKNINVSQVVPVVRAFHEHSVGVSAAFVVGFPEETQEDLAQTFALVERLLPWPNVTPVINVLSPHAGSAYDSEYQGQLLFDPTFSSQVTHSLDMNPEAFDFVRRHPDLCSSDYAFPLLHLDRDAVVHASRFHRYLFNRMRLAALVASRMVGSSYTLFKEWLSYLAAHDVTSPGEAFYAGPEFIRLFVMFLGQVEQQTPPGPWSHWLRLALEMQRSLDSATEVLVAGVPPPVRSLDEEARLWPGPTLAWSPLQPLHLSRILNGEEPVGSPPRGTWLRVAPPPPDQHDTTQKAPSNWEVEVRQPNDLVQEVLERARDGISVKELLRSLQSNPPLVQFPNVDQAWIHVVRTLLDQDYLVARAATAA